MRKTEGLVKCPNEFLRHINVFMPNRNHIFKTASEMATATLCAYPKSKYAFPHWKCILCCCENVPRIDLPSPE